MADLLNIKKDFPVLNNNPDLVYLDTGATALKPKCVIDKINEYYDKYGVNVNRGVYELSYEATTEYEETRTLTAKFLNAREKEILIRRYGLQRRIPQTQKAIAKDLHISRSYVSRIEKRALTKILREFLKNNISDWMKVSKKWQI